MSGAMSTAWSWRHAILQSELPPTTRFVLLTISCHMNDVGGGCYPSTRLLASESGLSERAVCEHIGKAVDAGWLVKTQHGFRGQKWRQNEYAAAWPKPSETPKSDTDSDPETGEKGTDAGSVPCGKGTDPHAEGTDPHDIKALTQGQSNFSRNFSHTLSNAGACEFLSDGLREQYADACTRFVDRVWACTRRPQTDDPATMLAELVKAIGNLDPHHLDAMADMAIAERVVFPPIPNVLGYRDTLHETITVHAKAGPEAWSAVLAFAEAHRPNKLAKLEADGTARVPRWWSLMGVKIQRGEIT